MFLISSAAVQSLLMIVLHNQKRYPFVVRLISESLCNDMLQIKSRHSVVLLCVHSINNRTVK